MRSRERLNEITNSLNPDTVPHADWMLLRISGALLIKIEPKEFLRNLLVMLASSGKLSDYAEELALEIAHYFHEDLNARK